MTFILENDTRSIVDGRGATIILTRIGSDRFKGSDGKEYLECGEGVFLPVTVPGHVPIPGLPVVRIATDPSLSAWDEMVIGFSEADQAPLIGVKAAGNEF